MSRARELEELFPIRFQDEKQQLDFDCNGYESVDGGFRIHCIVKEKDLNVGFIIFQEQLNHTLRCVRDSLNPQVHSPEILSARCAKVVLLCQTILEGILTLKAQMTKRFAPDKAWFEEKGFLACFKSVQVLHLGTHKQDGRPISLSETVSRPLLSVWCEPGALVCPKYGRLPPELFRAMTQKMLIDRNSVNLTDKREDGDCVWKQLSELSQMVLLPPCASSSPIAPPFACAPASASPLPHPLSVQTVVCRHHLLESAFFHKEPQVLSAALQYLKSLGGQRAQTTKEIRKRVARLVDYAAGTNSVDKLRLLLCSDVVQPPALTCTLPQQLENKVTSDPTAGGFFTLCTNRALYEAASGGRTKVVRMLLKSKAVARQEVIYTVCRNGQTEILELLLDAGIRFRPKEAALNAAYNSQWATLRALRLWVLECRSRRSTFPPPYVAMDYCWGNVHACLSQTEAAFVTACVEMTKSESYGDMDLPSVPAFVFE
jgi:hypothetical protein